MPFLIIHTNAVLKDNDMEQFLDAATDLLSEELRKPKGYIIVHYDYSKDISFGSRTDNKGALVELKSIGFGGRKADLAKILTEFLYDRLSGLDIKNINIEFVDMPASSLSIGGTLMG